MKRVKYLAAAWLCKLLSIVLVQRRSAIEEGWCSLICVHTTAFHFSSISVLWWLTYWTAGFLKVGCWCCLLNWSHFVVVWLQIFLNCKETLEASLQGSHCAWISSHPWPWSVGHGVSGGQGAHRRMHTLCVRWWEFVSNWTLLTLSGFVNA